MKTQKINRSNLKILYDNSYQDWQKIITNLVLFQEGKEIEVEEELIEKAYNAANSNQRVLLNKYFKLENEDLFSITTYSEVCKRLKIKELTIKDFKKFGEDALKMLGFHKIKNLERLFNGNWVKDWKNQSQYKYYPYFTINSSGGLVFFGSYAGYVVCYGPVGYYKDSKTSDHIGKNFKDVYENIM